MIITVKNRYKNYVNFETDNASNDFFNHISEVPYVHAYFQCSGSRSSIFTADTRQNKDAVCDQYK